MGKILGLDLGTNSIGWALVEIDHENKMVKILGLGSRILSMDAGEISTFESGGKLKSAASQKTTDKTARKLHERFLLRRDRLHCVLNLLKTLPTHYQVSIDFENEKGYRSGKFKKGTEVKLAYATDTNGKPRFLFMDSYNEMAKEFKAKNPLLFYKKRNGKETKIPYDWTLYYLRKKALKQEISKEELAWITLSFNQKRGYEKTIGQDEKEQKDGELSETFVGIVRSVTEVGEKDGLKLFEIVLIDEKNETELYRYNEESLFQITNKGDLKEFEIVSKFDEDGNINEKNTIYTVKEIRKIKVSDVKYTDEKKNENFVFEIYLQTGWIKKNQQSKYLPKWKDTERDFIIKTNYNKDGDRILKGTDEGRNINAPKEEDWTLLKLKTETELTSFNTKNRTVGIASFVYNALLEKPQQKIKGDLITVIERKYYRDELESIFECQRQFHPELEDPELYKRAINLLYPHNENHKRKLEGFLSKQPFSKLLTDDVILYQRDLKSKKSLIADCVYEKENYKRIDKKTGQEYHQPLKAIHKANPLYQEFRIWQFIKRLKIIQHEEVENDEILLNQDKSVLLLTNEIKEKLFEFLNNREHITQSVLLKHLGLSDKEYKWNYESDHKEPCNETRYNFILRLKRIKGFNWKAFLSPENEYQLWHFFYSVKKQDEFKTGINTLFEKLLVKSNISLELKADIVKNFISFGGYNNDYGTYSEKALKKILPFLRIGKYWEESKDKAISILGKIEHSVKVKVLTKENIQGEIIDFQGLWISSACYLVYNRYSEVGDVKYWTTPYDIERYLQNEFKQHSLNNPVVEKVLIETLQLVKDIWKTFAEQEGKDKNGNVVYKKLFDRINIELGREMKKNAKERKRESDQNNENKKTNERIIELLKELKRENNDVRPLSPFQQEKLKILEDDLLSSVEYDKDATVYKFSNNQYAITKKEIKDITTKDIAKVSKSDFERYKLWLDQRYQSPYTGKVIKLSDLFNREKYEIEHVFPQERITLNAFYNKVICETEVNKAKKAFTGYQFILNSQGTRKIKCSAHGNEEVTILSPEAYQKLVKDNFTDKKKQEILLSKDIPDEFTSSQLNNARYISKMAMKLLSNIVREEDEDSFRSKNVLPINGVITTKLKQDWQLNDAWNELIQPRFKRLNEITKSNLFGDYEKINGHEVFINRVPEELNNDFDKKRIDHRHHAMDALVIALATESHVNYLNNISAQNSKDKKFKERFDIKEKFMTSKKNDAGDKSRFFLPPAQFKQEGKVVEYSYGFTDNNSNVFKEIVLEALQNTIVSFKQTSRVIKQRTNKYQKWNEEKGKFELISQENLNKKEKYNIRLTLHKATYYGKVKLKQKTSNVLLIDAIGQVDSIVDNNLKEHIINLKEQKFQSHEIRNQLEKNHPKVEVFDDYVATRYENTLASLGVIASDKIITFIESITDIGIQKILLKHLAGYNSVEKSIKEAIQYVDIIANEEHQKVIKALLEKNFPFEEIEIDNKSISKTEVFTKGIELSIDEGKNLILNPQFAFSFEGINELNKNIKALNGGKEHKPIYKVRMFTPLGKKFPVSEDKEKGNKYVITAADSNIFCGFYTNEMGEREFFVPTLRETAENLKQGSNPCPEIIFKDNAKYELLFILSPNDLVYLPTKDEIQTPSIVNYQKLNKEQKNRIYKFTDGNSQGVMNFAPYCVATPLIDVSKADYKKLQLGKLIFTEVSKSGKDSKTKELVNEIGLGSTQSKNQNSLDSEQIKSICWKLKVDRLGNIKLATQIEVHENKTPGHPAKMMQKGDIEPANEH
jgi:CRISPR-associated endonuclease Csn1